MIAALAGLGASMSALAAAAPAHLTIAPASTTALPATAAAAGPSITLYSEPGLQGQSRTYRSVAADVERQGFVARSATSTGMWTLCEGGEVASRCQTVDGDDPALRLRPQILRPGLNALALYDQPGLKGRRVIYSFAADRPAPFHARSARTWGGAWSLCDRDFHHCQTLDGKSPSLDLTVAAVRPEPGDAAPEPLPVKTRARTAPAIAAPTKVRAPAAAPAPVVIPAAMPREPRRPSTPRHARAVTVPVLIAPRHAPKLLHVDARRAPLHDSAIRPRHGGIERASLEKPRRTHDLGRSRPGQQTHRLLTPVRATARDHLRHARGMVRVHQVRPSRHLTHAYQRTERVSDHHARNFRMLRRRLYHRIRMFWGPPERDLYDFGPRDDGRW